MVDYADRPWLGRYDANVPKSLEYPEITVHSLLEQSAQDHPDAPACQTSVALPVFGRKAGIISYSQLNKMADTLAAAELHSVCHRVLCGAESRGSDCRDESAISG
jgi:hypothetical protein